MLARLLFWNPESDDGFRTEIRRGSLLSLRAVGVLQVVLPLLMLAAGLGLMPVPVTGWNTALPNLLFAGVGALTLLAALTLPGKRRPRICAATSIWLTVVIMMRSALLLPYQVEWLERHLLGYTILVMFGAAAAVPFRAVHTLVLGLSINALQAGMFYALRDLYVDAGVEWTMAEQLVGLTVTVLCTLLTASVYSQRFTGYRRHVEALHTSERLREAQGKLLVSENAATMGRVAAALSHELNSPVGVLSSSVDTLAHLVEKMAAPSTEPERERLKRVAADVVRSGRESGERLRALVGRMQRFTNLDRAETLPMNLNELLTDVLALVEPDIRSRVNVVREFHQLPPFVCRPQQMSAVFSNLVSNAMRAVGDGGQVAVITHAARDQIEVRISDTGAGIPPEQMATLFDPGAFRVSEGRMAAGNWSLFSCRQIIREHGGEIEVKSEPGRGTTVCVLLPCQTSS